MKPTDWLGLALAVGAGVILVMVTLNTPVPASDVPTYLAMARDGEWDVVMGTLADGRSFVNAAWLFQRGAYGAFRLGGWELLVALNAAAVAAALGLAGVAGWNRARGPGAGLAVFLASMLMLQNTAMRPQTTVYALALAVLLAPRVWQVALVSILWANLHGSFILAPVFAAIGAPHGRLRHVVVASLAGLVTPWGWRTFAYVLDNSSLPADRGLDEWSAPDLLTPLGVRLFFVLVLGVGLALRKRPPRTEVIAFAVLGGLALTGVRHVAWLGLAAGPLIAGWLPPVGEGTARHARTVFLAVAAIALVGLVRFAPWLRDAPTPRATDAWLEPQAPVEALALLDELEPGLVHVPFQQGGLVRWRHPEWRTQADVRVWLYTDEEWAAYETSRVDPDGLVLVDRRREPWLDRSTADWTVLHQDTRWSLRSPRPPR
ncbi:MAG: hypothetical protein GY913_33550 [Proteobacteria bacterium]|nr:hypothetical protein [Pseudomonadota bacterium]MCP4921853.1 hypothetical protein [Pseudomonadota bacterium]